MKFLLALYSRMRAPLLVDTIQKTIAAMALPETEIMVMVDEDDAPSIELLSNKWQTFNGRATISMRPREDTVGEKVNRAIQVRADLYMPMVDHTIFTTQGFDARIVEAAQRYSDGIYAVHTNMANPSFAFYNAIPRRWVELLGEIYPTYFPYWFVDHWTDDLARMIGRIAYADVMCDSSKKPGTQEMREPGWWATFFDACRMERRRQAQILIGGMAGSHGEMGHHNNLIASFPLTEYRSKWINDNVRQMDRQLAFSSGLSPKDERYQRTKAKAIAELPRLMQGLPQQEAEAYMNALSPPTIITNIPQAYAPLQLVPA